MSRRSTPSTSAAAAAASGNNGNNHHQNNNNGSGSNTSIDRQHSIGVSYAYGAPTTYSPATRSTRAATTRAQSVTSARSASVDNATADDTGRPEDPAVVRYAKMKQRRKDTGHPFPIKNKPPADTDLRDTSVNIATAFKIASGPSDMILPSAGRGADPGQEAEGEDNDDDDDDQEAQKETHVRPQTNGNKRKKHATIDPAFKQPSVSSSSGSENDSDAHESKRARQEAAEVVSVSSSQPMRKRKSKDTSYRPPKPTAEDGESTELTDDGPRRKGRRQREISGGGDQAIVRGKRDNEVWQSPKKRKGRRKSRPSNGTHESGESEESGEEDERQEELGGMDGYNDDPGDLSLRAELDQADNTSIFLRPADSPSPGRPDRNSLDRASPEASTSMPTFSTILSPPPVRRRFGMSSSRRNQDQVQARDQDVSLNQANPSSASASYDYTTEEQLLRVFEQEEALRKARQQLTASRDGPSRSLPPAKRQLGRVPSPVREQHPQPGVATVLGHSLRALSRRLDSLNLAQIAGLGLLALLAMSLLLSRSRATHFSSSQTAPENMPELAQRLLKIEGVLSGLSTAHDEEGRRLGHLDSDLHVLSDRLKRLERDSAASDLRSEQSDLRSLVKSIQHSIDEAKSELHASKREVDQLKALPQPALRVEKGRVVVDRAVEAHLREMLAKEAIPKDLVDRKTMSDAIKREIRTLKRDFEEQANDNVQRIGEELLAKYAKAEQLKASHGSHPFARGGEDVSSDATLNAIMDAAILRYSKDVFARPDYALFTAGARVIPSLTSPTYEAKPEGGVAKALGWITGRSSIVGRPPATALHPDNSLGSCWPFAGSTGQLGILLSRKVVPTDITIEHASRDVALDGDVKSAPREFEVWGVVDDAADIVRLEEYRRTVSSTRTGDQEAAEPTSIPPTAQHILIARGTYDVERPDPRQTFDVTDEAASVKAAISVVVLKILSNHGDTNLTCLYRIRVGGSSSH